MDQGIETEGSNLSGVSAKCVWDDLSQPPEDEEDSRSICLGSQPRRLSNKGKAPPHIEVKLFLPQKKTFSAFFDMFKNRHGANQRDIKKRTGV